MIRARALARKLDFRVEFIGPIPATIQTDPLRLRQILINILGNAVKFTESGGIRLVVRLLTDRHTPQLQFDIVDTGLGMTADQAEHLFEPFHQVDPSLTRRFGGTGLGLTISKRLASLLGGDVTLVESQPGAGTRFRLTVSTGSLVGVEMVDGALNQSALTVQQIGRAHV